MPRLTAITERRFKIPGDPDKAELKIKHLKTGEIQRIESDTTEWLGKNVGEKFSTELKFNPTAQMRALRVAAVTDWKGFFGIDGEALECTTANINKYLDEDPLLGAGDDAKPFSEWIDQFRKTLADEMTAKEEKVEKN